MGNRGNLEEMPACEMGKVIVPRRGEPTANNGQLTTDHHLGRPAAQPLAGYHFTE